MHVGRLQHPARLSAAWGAQACELRLQLQIPLTPCTAPQGGTYGGSAIGCAAAAATIDVIEEEGLLQNAAERGEQLARGLLSLAEVSGPGWGGWGWVGVGVG